jgi:hypothetical protein
MLWIGSAVVFHTVQLLRINRLCNLIQSMVMIVFPPFYMAMIYYLWQDLIMTGTGFIIQMVLFGLFSTVAFKLAKELRKLGLSHSESLWKETLIHMVWVVGFLKTNKAIGEFLKGQEVDRTEGR